MSKKPVLVPKAERRQAALVIAVKLAQKLGAKRVSMAMVAAKQKVTAPLLFHIFESRDGLTKAILKEAKKQGLALPEGAPTVREAREAARGVGKPKKLAKLKAPVKRAAPVKKSPGLAPLKKAVSKKVAAAIPTPPRTTVVRGKAVDNKVLSGLKQRKPLTDAQREAKRARDKQRRAPAPVAVPKTPAAKFAALPKPFEAAMQQVTGE